MEAARQPTIAVSESDLAVRLLFDELLRDAGYGVELLDPQALSAGHLAAAAPDLALLEITPASTAVVLGCVRQLRHHPDTAGLPVLLSTTDSTFAARRAGELERLGCQVLLKPFDLDQLTRRLRGQLDDSGVTRGGSFGVA